MPYRGAFTSRKPRRPMQEAAFVRRCRLRDVYLAPRIGRGACACGHLRALEAVTKTRWTPLRAHETTRQDPPLGW